MVSDKFKANAATLTKQGIFHGVKVILLSFVIWKGTESYLKLLEDKSTITVSKKYVWELEDKKIPTLTICPSTMAFNQQKLEEYGISDKDVCVVIME